MNHIEQKDLSCKWNCEFVQGGLRQCGTGYKKTEKKAGITGYPNATKLVPDRQPCHNNLSALINELDEIRPDNAVMTDGDPTLPFILIISYQTNEGIIPVGGVYDGTYYPILIEDMTIQATISNP